MGRNGNQNGQHTLDATAERSLARFSFGRKWVWSTSIGLEYSLGQWFIEADYEIIHQIVDNVDCSSCDFDG